MDLIDGLDAAGLLVVTAAHLLPAALFLWWGFRLPAERTDRWAAARGVALTAEVRPYVADRLRRARRWRTVGFTLGWLGPYAHLWLTRSAYDGIDLPQLPIVGYVLFGLAAELLAVRRTPPSGVAALSARQLDSYLPRRARAWARWVAAGSIGVVVAAVTLPARQDEVFTVGALLTGTVAVIGLLLVVEVLPRLVVGQRQPFTSPDLVAADDAMRSWSAHAVTGALLATMLLVVSGQVLQLGTTSELQGIRWTAPITGVLLVGVAIGTFQLLSGYGWRWRVVRGPVPGAR